MKIDYFGTIKQRYNIFLWNLSEALGLALKDPEKILGNIFEVKKSENTQHG